MKKTLLLIATAIMLSSCCGVKKLQKEAAIKTDPVSLDLIANSYKNPVVDVDFDILVAKKSINRKSQLIYQPLFLTTTNNLNLTPVVINGKKRAKDEAKMIKNGKKLPYSNAIRVNDIKKDVSIDYSVSAPVSDWMPGSELVGWTMVNCGKKHKEAVVDRHLIATGIRIPEEPETNQPTMVTKSRTNDMDLSKTTYFMINSSTIDPMLDQNSNNATKLKQLMSEINSSSDKSLVSIEITGSASPEGTEKINSKLSMDRAEAVANMIIEEFGINRSMIHVKSVGSNWNGLVESVDRSSLSNKNQITSISNSNQSDWQKTMRLRRLSNFSELKTDYLPPLRYVICKVNYTVKESYSEPAPATEVITLY